MPAAQQLQTPDEAYALLSQQVYIPVLRNKLAADYGIQANTEEELRDMLDIAAQLRSMYDASSQTKTAARTTLLQQAKQHLHKTAGHAGQNDMALEAQIKQASAQLALRPETIRAALSLMAAGNQAA